MTPPRGRGRMTAGELSDQPDDIRWQRPLPIPSMRPAFSTASAAGSRSRRRPRRPPRSTSSPTSSRPAMPTCRRRLSASPGVTAAAIISSCARPGARKRPASWCSATSTPCIRWGSSRGCHSGSTATAPIGPGIYDMKGGAYLAYHAFRQICADPARVAARHHPSVRVRRGDRQPDLARADRGGGAQGQICAGDGARARRRQDRHRAQGRRPLRRVREGRAGACRREAAGRPQRHSRARQHHPDAGGDERFTSAASPSMSA